MTTLAYVDAKTPPFIVIFFVGFDAKITATLLQHQNGRHDGKYIHVYFFFAS